MCAYLYIAYGNLMNVSLAQQSFIDYSPNKTICFDFVVKQVRNLVLPTVYSVQDYLSD